MISNYCLLKGYKPYSVFLYLLYLYGIIIAVFDLMCAARHPLQCYLTLS